MTKEKALDLLFKENTEDLKKNQSYKDNFKEYELPSKYFLLEMYNRQKQLQMFLADRGKTSKFPNQVKDLRQEDVQLAIYHLFCMQIEFNELKIELHKLFEDKEADTIDARYELIDMFFFMFNVGIYTGLDILAVVDYIDTLCVAVDPPEKQITNVTDIDNAIYELMNYLDKLPWKAWKEYDYFTFDFYNPQIIMSYGNAIKYMLTFAKEVFKETEQSLFNLYMNKWEENKRRQMDLSSGYILNERDKSS